MSNDLYNTLELSKDSNIIEIKKQYKKLAMRHHPDRGGDSEKFKQISEAYDILSDEGKKKNYDNNSNKQDIFSSMFGNMNEMGMGGMSMGGMSMGGMGMGGIGEMFNRNKNNPNKNKIVKVDITLEDIYLGCKKKINIDIYSKCKKCTGNGYFDDGKELCHKCNGNKIIIGTQELAPGIVQQMQMKCDNCNGNGFTIKEENKCSKCDGEGQKIKNMEYDLNIKKGSYNNKEIILKNKGDYIKNLDLKGDLLLKLQLLEHDLFICKNNNLYKEIDIPLGKALCGGYLKIDYLNKEEIYLDIDKIIKPNYLMKINGKGLPRQTENLLYGDLIIKFNIDFPDNLCTDKHKLLKNVFNINDIDIPENIEINNIEYYDNKLETENEENEENIQENIQCPQQ